MDRSMMRKYFNLPKELLVEILIKLPVKSLVRFKCVSKSWKTLIESKDFVKLNLKQSNPNNGSVILYSYGSLHSFDFHQPERLATKLWFPLEEEGYFEHRYQVLVGSCNGLLCFACVFHYALYNPTTRTFKKLPRQIIKGIFKYCTYQRHNMFAYDCVGDDYKVVSFIMCEYTLYKIDSIKAKTQLYSMKTNSWEIIQNPPWKFNFLHSKGVTFNNSLHWTEQNTMRSFDLYTRMYEELTLPEEIGQEGSRLAVFRGHIYVVTDSLEVWRLNKDSMMEKSLWSRLFRCSLENMVSSSFDVMLCPLPICGMKPIQATSTKKKVDSIIIICFDLESQDVSEVKIKGLPNDPLGFYAESWVESLAPL